jgi:hypothetical protein
VFSLCSPQTTAHQVENLLMIDRSYCRTMRALDVVGKDLQLGHRVRF